VSDQAPFISGPDRDPIPPAPWRVFKVPGFMPLFGAQFASSLGDWIGLFAILAIAKDVSNSATAVGLVMVARMLPGFLFAPLGGALIDRWNRKTVMVSADIGRAALLATLPFWDSIWGLVILSFAIEMLTLLWGPAKDATLPNIVKDPGQLASANSLGLVAAFGTFPIGAIMFAALAGIGSALGGLKQESLAIWVDGGTFLLSAFLISLAAGSDPTASETGIVSLLWSFLLIGGYVAVVEWMLRRRPLPRTLVLAPPAPVG